MSKPRQPPRPARRCPPSNAARALRQARPAALHQPPRLPAGLRAGAAPRRRADGLLGRLLAAPEGLLRRGRAHRGGQRGGVPRDRRHRALRPGPAAGGARPVTAARSGRPGDRGGARRTAWPTGCRPRCGRSCSRGWPTRAAAAAVRGLPRRRARRGQPDDQERAAHLRRPRRGPCASSWPRSRAARRPGPPRVRYFDWSCSTSHLPYDPTMSSPDSVRWATSRRR